MKKGVWLLPSLLLLVGCENSALLGEFSAVRPAPAISALSVDALAVGGVLSFEGSGFVSQSEGTVDVRFVGEFFPDDGGAPSSVNRVVALEATAENLLIWDGFGRYRVPFGSGDETGVFRGEVSAENHFFVVGARPGEVSSAPRVPQQVEPIQVELQVLPSLIVLDNRAFGTSFVADCIDPADVVLETLHYALRVKAIGFSPETISFSLAPGMLRSDAGSWVVTEEREEHAFPTNGARELAVSHRWAPVPRYHMGYGADVRVSAEAPQGSVSVDFPMLVVPAAGPDFWRGPEVAERFDPVPVSGCIPGGSNGVSVGYSEATSETRSRTQTSSFSDSINAFSQVRHGSSFCCERQAFASPRSEAVQMADLTRGQAFVPAETDLFATRPLRIQTTDMGWQRDVGEEPVSTLLVAAAGASNMGSEPIPGLWSEPRDTVRWDIRETLGLLRSAPDRFSVEYEPFPGNVLPTNGSWGFTRRYSEQLESSEVRRLAGYESLQSVQTESAEIDGQLPVSDEELVSASSANSIARAALAFVWAGREGMWFRQTSRVQYQGVYVVRDLCGNGTVVAESSVDDWMWAEDLGIGESCPPVTNFLPGECLIPPCT